MKTTIRYILIFSALIMAGLVRAATITVVDLAGVTELVGVPVNDGFVSDIDPQSTGTGIIDPFLREQGTSGPNGSEQGINTSIASPPYDDKPGPWTHDVLVGTLGTVIYNGVSYYQFTLDANQSNNGPISLIDFKIYVTTGAPFTLASQLTNLVSTGTPAFNMNGGSTQYRVDISSENGSGSGDMYFLVPVSDIGTIPLSNLYLYAAFGLDSNGAGYVPNDGFEEWYATLGGPISVPDGGITVALIGLSLLGLAGFRSRFMRR